MENALLSAVTSGIGTVISWIGAVLDSMIGESGELAALLPLFAIGIAISAILLGGLYAETKSGKYGEA